jgi:hypothetical protein
LHSGIELGCHRDLSRCHLFGICENEYLYFLLVALPALSVSTCWVALSCADVWGADDVDDSHSFLPPLIKPSEGLLSLSAQCLDLLGSVITTDVWVANDDADDSSSSVVPVPGLQKLSHFQPRVSTCWVALSSTDAWGGDDDDDSSSSVGLAIEPSGMLHSHSTPHLAAQERWGPKSLSQVDRKIIGQYAKPDLHYTFIPNLSNQVRFRQGEQQESVVRRNRTAFPLGPLPRCCSPSSWR